MPSSSRVSVRNVYAVPAVFLAAWVGLTIAVYRSPVRGSVRASSAAARTEAPVAAADGSTAVSFALLAGFVYDPPPLAYDADGNPRPADTTRDPVPRAVRALSGRRVSVSGYMIPYDFADGACAKFALSEFPPTCCFGCTALPNNWIEVTMRDGRKAACSSAGTVRVVGVLEVAGLDDELATLYAIKGESVAAEQPR